MAEGIVIIDKPAEWTSMDVCAKLRGILKTKKVGHAGTLDPMATGVLPVFVGQATRGVSFAESGEKEYVATLRLGLTTDTQDSTGNLLTTASVTATAADVMAVLPQFTGDILQIPPMYSAIKIGGQKLYDLARQGREVERKPRPVIIYQLELLEQVNEAEFLLRVRCSKGTYIRTLCHDIGQALGCGGVMSSLRRTMAAGFTLEEAVTIDEVQEKGEAVLRPVDTLFRHCGEYRITHQRVEFLCRNGNPFTPREKVEDGLYRVYGMDGTFLCLSRCEAGQMTSVKNFFGA
ncbi:MAG: tRNA pseudouridine(55) synthase TruB [Oscillospiraceae bacterium]|nr:tRNA pseudouridine(55) synthase TruB [Oscillospiraceae bacterium]